jgi:phosphoglycerol transferase MdoB-like AlkP superfamily enzyme
MGAMRRVLEAIRAKSDLSWDRFFTEFQKDVKLWLVCMACLQLGRLVFIVWLRRFIAEESGVGSVIAVMLNGVRFDSMVAGWWVFFPVLAGVVAGFFDITRFARRFRFGFAVAFVAATVLIYQIAVGYFEEYADVFNHWVFGLIYDDAGAVGETVWAQYNVPLTAVMVAAVVTGAVFFFRWFLKTGLVSEERYARVFSTRRRRIAASVLFSVVYFVAVRGSVGPRPAQRKDAGVTKDSFLNKSAMNPYSALYYAIRENRRISRAEGLRTYLPDGDLLAAARYVFGTDEVHGDLDRYMLKRARGARIEKPTHVFVIVMESYDSWPMLPQYEGLRATERLKALAREGVWVKSFLPASDGTMTSLSAIVTNMPDAGVVTNYQPSASEPYPSSIAETFRRLGYRTRLFYSGYLSWQRIGDFCRNQGFEEVYGGAHMGSWGVTNGWGVRDEDLFGFVAGELDDATPSFNLLLTSTYHPPYDIDVYAEGYPVRETPGDLVPVHDSGVALDVIGHLWYSDRCLGEFVARVSRDHPSSLFALTGDHYSRKHVRARPGIYEDYSVPLVLYGKHVLRKEILEKMGLPAAPAGAHIDIAPTLVELIAPEGFEYHSIGRDVLAEAAPPYGVARRRVIGRDFIFDVGETLALEAIPGVELPADLPDARELKRLHDATHAVAWWRVMRGAKFDPDAADGE